MEGVILMMENYQAISNFGVLIIIAGLYLWQTPKMIEKITKVVESNTNVIKDTKVYHQKMEECLNDMKHDIEQLKEAGKDSEECKEILLRIESKVDALGK